MDHVKAAREFLATNAQLSDDEALQQMTAQGINRRKARWELVQRRHKQASSRAALREQDKGDAEAWQKRWGTQG